MHTHIILWYSTFTQIYTHWPDRNAVLASRQCLLHIMTGCCKSSCGTVVHTGAVTWYDFPSNISLRYAFVKNLMMWTRDVIRSRQPAKISGNSSCQRWLLFLFKKNNERKFIKYQQYNVVRVSTDQHVYVCRSLQTRYDYNLTIMKSQVSQTGYWQQV